MKKLRCTTTVKDVFITIVYDHITSRSHHFMSACQVMGGSLLGSGLTWLASYPGTIKCHVNCTWPFSMIEVRCTGGPRSSLGLRVYHHPTIANVSNALLDITTELDHMKYSICTSCKPSTGNSRLLFICDGLDAWWCFKWLHLSCHFHVYSVIFSEVSILIEGVALFIFLMGSILQMDSGRIPPDGLQPLGILRRL